MRKKYLFYAISLVSAFFITISSFLDKTIIDRVEEPLSYTAALFLVSTMVIASLSLLFSIRLRGKSLGQLIDPSFSCLRTMRKEELKYQLFSGLGNALTTIAYAALLYLFDPSVTLPFSYVVIMYLLGIEMISEKNSPTFAELQSSIIITFGAIMASLSLGGINPRGLLIVFLVQNPTSALFSIYQRKLKSLRIDGSPNDSINIRFWNLIFTAIFATVIALLLKPSSNLIPIIHENLPMLSLTALITSFSLILYIRALGMAKASVAQAFRATSLIFAMPIALSQFYGDPLFALIKSMGIVLVALGVTSFALTEVRAFLLVKVGRGISFKRVMERIWEIQGVDSVAMVAGEYDIIVKVRTRTLGKGYERIIGEIEKIEGIEDFKWNSILKEWEEI